MAVLAFLLPVLGSRSVSAIEVGFCDDHGRGFYDKQPRNHLERWQLPTDNGTHLVINWKIDPRMANRNVTSYFVDVQTSQPVLNLFVGRFGGFPQDICAADGSKARDAVKTSDAVPQPTCSPYLADAPGVQRSTSFEIPDALRLMASWNVDVVVRSYGSHGPINGGPHESVPCVWWCHTYRRSRNSSNARAVEDTQLITIDWRHSMREWLNWTTCFWSCTEEPPAVPKRREQTQKRRPAWPWAFLRRRWLSLRGKTEL